jgi:hypothetical protein
VKLSCDEWQATYGVEVASSAAADDGYDEAPTPDATIVRKVDLVGHRVTCTRHALYSAR